LDDGAILAISGSVSLLLAVVAILLAIRAILARRVDRGVELSYPIAGIACGAANLLCGSGILATGAGWLTPTDGQPWTWRSEKHNFEVTIPSERWSKQSNPHVIAEFRCSRPTLIAVVAQALPAATDAEYETALAFGRKVRDKSPGAIQMVEKSGRNEYGHPYWTAAGDASAKDGDYFFGVSITRVGDKAILMMFEGPYRMRSQAGHERESYALRTQAELFLGSVK